MAFNEGKCRPDVVTYRLPPTVMCAAGRLERWSFTEEMVFHSTAAATSSDEVRWRHAGRGEIELKVDGFL
ncbi:hypothetical protein HPP92_000519 [Vanilla planifolia]|uniref:Uncharacterized protein n=1 Tax=Vanilla planifolia TaxID=51239 RepID=A0A835SBC0_VANPL|nr:hypothetical protein HPP92_000559 [Vanilla planifolia]KAG0500447.1 hypothetical protein HPP92_000519 [Vanilla planifolia]